MTLTIGCPSRRVTWTLECWGGRERVGLEAVPSFIEIAVAAQKEVGVPPTLLRPLCFSWCHVSES
jgi:hypothetical protein